MLERLAKAERLLRYSVSEQVRGRAVSNSLGYLALGIGQPVLERAHALPLRQPAMVSGDAQSEELTGDTVFELEGVRCSGKLVALGVFMARAPCRMHSAESAAVFPEVMPESSQMSPFGIPKATAWPWASSATASEAIAQIVRLVPREPLRGDRIGWSQCRSSPYLSELPIPAVVIAFPPSRQEPSSI